MRMYDFLWVYICECMIFYGPNVPEIKLFYSIVGVLRWLWKHWECLEAGTQTSQVKPLVYIIPLISVYRWSNTENVENLKNTEIW